MCRIWYACSLDLAWISEPQSFCFDSSSYLYLLCSFIEVNKAEEDARIYINFWDHCIYNMLSLINVLWRWLIDRPKLWRLLLFLAIKIGLFSRERERVCVYVPFFYCFECALFVLGKQPWFLQKQIQANRFLSFKMANPIWKTLIYV